MSSKRDEISLLRQELNNAKLETRKAAVKKVIAAMTTGKDVKDCFSDVLKCVETEDLELKKLVYLYIINYAKVMPEQALMAINTFRKDATERVNPLVRSLAVRTMGCIGIEPVLDYLLGPLMDTLNDEDPYVRKTAAMCVAKVNDLNPAKVESMGALGKLKELLFDGNGMVVANACAAVSEINKTKSQPLVTMNQDLLGQLLNALPECQPWGRIVILDFISDNLKPSDMNEVTVNRVVPNLAHGHAAVVLSSVKIILIYLMRLDPESDKAKSLIRKLAPPLVSLMHTESEIQYIVLRNINLLLQRWPQMFAGAMRAFFCDFKDPLFIKLQKLDILVRLADNQNFDAILQEFKDHAGEVDVQFARKAIYAVGQVAIKLPDVAERCVFVFHELLKQKPAQYIVEEIVIVIRDIFRQFPGQFESIIKDLCTYLTNLDNSDARSSMVWIIGEYAERIENSVQLLSHFSKSFKDEAKGVQLQILIASVKTYLKLEDPAEELVKTVLELATDESDNPDLRNRGYIYWRMLSEDPEACKQIVLCKRPPMRQVQGSLQLQIRDQLIGNLGYASSIYHMPAHLFVKAARERVNEQYEAENVGAELITEVDDSSGKGWRRDTFKKQQTDPHIVNPMNLPEETKEHDTDLVLDAQGDPVIDPIGQSIKDQVSLPAPFLPVLSSSTKGQKGQCGISVEAAFQRPNFNSKVMILQLKVCNTTLAEIKNLFTKFDLNFLGVQIDPAHQSKEVTLMPNQTMTLNFNCAIGINANNSAPPSQPPMNLKAGLNCSLDLFFFDVPVLYHTLCETPTGEQPKPNQYAELVNQQGNMTHSITKLPDSILNAQKLIERMTLNGWCFLGGQNQNAYFKLSQCVIEIGITPQKSVNMKAFSTKQFEIPLMLQSLTFILSQ